MDWPTAVANTFEYLSNAGIAWAVAYAVVGFFRAIAGPGGVK